MYSQQGRQRQKENKVTKQELNNMWAEMQLNNEASKLSGERYVSIWWSIKEDGEAIIVDKVESNNALEARYDFQINVRSTKEALKTCKIFESVYICCALGARSGKHYKLLEQYTFTTL